MPNNKGKQFEAKLKECWLRQPGATIDRLYDQTGMYYGVRNIADFIGYKYPHIFYLEAKSIKGNTFPLTNLSQYEDLLGKTFIEGVRAGVVIWYYEKDRVIFVPIVTIREMKRDGLKSVNITKLDNSKYYFINIPSIKKHVLMDSDYSALQFLPEDEEIVNTYYKED